MKRTVWPALESVLRHGGVPQPELPEFGGSVWFVTSSFSLGHQEAEVETRKGRLISGTGSVADADAPLIGSVSGRELDASTVEGSDQRMRRPE
jgi:hypothetical protein